MEFKTIIFEKEASYAVITLNRPDKLNACDLTMFEEIYAALDDVENDKNMKAVIFTGSGNRAFSSGVDRDTFASIESYEDSTEFVRIDARTFRKIENLPQPVISAVNGIATGLGCKIPLVSDVVIASENARFSLPGVSIGAVHMITVGRGRDVLGRTRLANMLITGETIDANKAEHYGIVNKVVAPELLMKEARETAEKISQFPPATVRILKRLLHRGADDDYRLEDVFTPSILVMDEMKQRVKMKK